MIWRRGELPYEGRHFPRTLHGKPQDPLRPARLARALLKAAGKDERANRRQPDRSKGGAPPFDHCAALVARLPAHERRRVALRLQQERGGLGAADAEWYVGQALAAAQCGWRPAQVHELFRAALSGTLQGPRPAGTWTDGERSLQLPLAALEELPEQARAPFVSYLRTALTVRMGCRTAAWTPGEGRRPADGRAPDAPVSDPAAPGAFLDRLRALLGLPYDVDALLPHGDPFAAAARCELGTDLYRPPALDLLERLGRVTSVRPSYAWLGGMGELLHDSPEAHRTVRRLLRAARGEPADCEHAAPLHRGLIGERTGWLLAGLAWAACVSNDPEAVRELGEALLAVDRGPSGAGPALFLRGGLAALAALARDPAPGRHRRLLTGAPASAVRAATEAKARLAHLPPADGRRTLQVPAGPYTAVFRVRADGDVRLEFRNPHGRHLAHPPSKIRHGDPALHTALQTQLAALRADMAAHLGLLAELRHADPGRPAARWIAAHLDDPLFEPLTRALVWQADTPNGPVVGMPVRRKSSTGWVLRDLRGRVHELPGDLTVRLWDPACADAAETAAWTRAATRRALLQPVPQLPPHP
ncbi:DUF4132 domain-containing protein [Streptomyces sp. CA2R106]|uniref:DUF4132 domain-containing protein n=1 Tax=Streptomyces sp. CA2R106 TaxID=3120153 RepID=UPI00300B8A16